MRWSKKSFVVFILVLLLIAGGCSPQREQGLKNEVPAGKLKLSPDVLADIYLGKIKKWMAKPYWFPSWLNNLSLITSPAGSSPSVTATPSTFG